MTFHSFLFEIQQRLLIPWRALRSWHLLWLTVFNAEGRQHFLEHPVKLSSLEARIVHDLATTGIALTTLDELFPGEGTLAVLQTEAERLRPIAEQMTNKKPFILEHWEAVPTFSLDNPFVRLSLSPRVLHIVNAYMGLWSKFYYFMLGRTMPVGESVEAKASQRWHRDFEEVQMCKMFIYLSDVDEQAGPFTYVLGSQRGGPWRRVFPQRPGRGYYPPQGAVERKIPTSAIRLMTGKAGTVIFADTTGLHRGGFSKTTERLMYTAGYNSSAAFGRRRYYISRAEEEQVAALSSEAAFSLRGMRPDHES